MSNHAVRRSSRVLVTLGRGLALAAIPALSASALAQASGGTNGLSGGGDEAAVRQSASPVKIASDLFDRGEFIRARSILENLIRGGSVETMSDEDRANALELMRRVEAGLRTADPMTVSLQKAELSLEEGDLRQAERHAAAVSAKAGSDRVLKARADGLLRQVAERKAELAPLAPGLVEQAMADFAKGDYAAAKAAIVAVMRTGATLPLDEEQRLESYRLKINDVERTRGEVFRVDGQAMAMLQPGTVRRTGGGGETPAETMTPAPAEAPVAQPIEPATLAQAEPAPQPQPETVPPPAAPAEPTWTPPPAVESGDQVIAAAMRADAQRVLAEADAAFDARRYNEAIEKYNLVIGTYGQYLDGSSSARAQSRLSEARMQLQQNAPGELATQVGMQTSIIRQQAQAEFENAVSQAQAALAAGDPGKARDQMARAQLSIFGRRNVFSESELQDYSKKIADERAKIDSKEEEIRRAELAKQEDEAKVREEAVLRDRDLTRSRKINESIDRVRALQQERKYEEALQVVDEVLFLDPNEPSALLLREILKDIIIYTKFNQLKALKDYRHSLLTLDNDESMIPPRGIMDFPADWPQKSFNRGELSAFAEPPENRRVLAEMENRRIPANFQDNTLADVLTFLESVTNLDMDVDWDALSEISINKDTPVTLRVREAPARVILDRVLEKVSGDQFGDKAGWWVSNGLLTVSSDSRLRRNTTLVIYNITDLLLDIPDYPDVPQIDLDSVLEQADGGGGSPFQENEDNEDDERPTRQEKIDQIVEIIQANVDFDGWRDNGGETGALQELNGSLIITNTPRNHREISGLLSKLREIRNMQINVETKFLLVNQNWFEQIGFDIDLVLNADNNQVRAAQGVTPVAQAGDFFDFAGGGSAGVGAGRRGLQRSIGGEVDLNGDGDFTDTGETSDPFVVQNPQGWSPVSGQQNSLGLAGGLAQASSFASDILSSAPALGIAGQFLDDVQVDFLIVATQADQRTVQLTAPRLTFTNGQTANIFVVTQQAFISDLTPVVGDSAVGFDPEVEAVSEGVTMLVEGVISSDRRYVTMNVDAGIGRINEFTNVPVVALAGGQLVNSESAQQFIQLPNVTVTRVRTTVTVPDEGTVLLGGQRLVTEVEVETGVPVLSKLPIINRFFTNRIESKEEQTLLILVKPTVLIQSEEEEKNFPGLTDSVRSGLR